MLLCQILSQFALEACEQATVLLALVPLFARAVMGQTGQKMA